MLVEVKRDNGRSESGSAEGSTAVGESPEGAGPTAVGQNPTGAGPTAVRETILRYGGLRNFGETGHGEAPVLVEVGPEKDQPDQPGRAGEMGIPWRRRHGTWHLVVAPTARRSSRLCESDITDFLETGRRDWTLGMS